MSENKLLENAKYSIQLGIEDYRLAKQNPIRNISSIRNIFTGLLLLYKYKLIKESPQMICTPKVGLNNQLTKV